MTDSTFPVLPDCTHAPFSPAYPCARCHIAEEEAWEAYLAWAHAEQERTGEDVI